MDTRKAALEIFKYVGLPVNPLGQNTTKKECLNSIESILNELVEEAVNVYATESHVQKIEAVKQARAEGWNAAREKARQITLGEVLEKADDLCPRCKINAFGTIDKIADRIAAMQPYGEGEGK